MVWRATRDACRLIQNNQMTRSKAIEMAKNYDSEFPKMYFEEAIDFLGINKNQFDEIVNKHRNAEVWQIKNNNWELKNKVYEKYNK